MNKVLLVITINVLCLLIINFDIKAQSSWSDWKQSNCFSGLDFCTRRSSYNNYAKKWEWQVKFRNRYQVPITINFEIASSDATSATTTNRKTIQAGSVSSESWRLLADNYNVMIFIDHVRLGSDTGAYANCDN